MKPAYRALRINQLDRALAPFRPAMDSPRPQRGWIHALRQASGVTLRELASSMRCRPPEVIQFEKSEATDRITLKSLRRAAEALDCELVYALVPRQASLRETLQERALGLAEREVRAVEHTMALEDQAVGDTQARARREARRKLASDR